MEISTTAESNLFDNLTLAVSNVSDKQKKHVADVEYDVQIRIYFMVVEVILGSIGCFCVCVWMRHNWKRKSRINSLILNLTISDCMVLYFSCVAQIVWESIPEREWFAGHVGCKIFKFLQVYALFSSTYMLVVIGIDRHQAIRAPLREPFAVWKLAAIGWVTSGFLAAPQLYIFSQRVVKNVTKCEGIFRIKPMSHRQAYMIYVSMTSFFIPLIIIAVCYTRIFLKIAEKANEGNFHRSQRIKPGKVHLQCTAGTSLPKAKIKTLKMTVVIVVSFIICTLPLVVCELIFSFGDYNTVPEILYSIIGGLAVANSVTNPFVFLAFNSNEKCVRSILRKICPFVKPKADPRDFDSNVGSMTVTTEVTRTVSRYGGPAPDILELGASKEDQQANGFRPSKPPRGKSVEYTMMVHQ